MAENGGIASVKSWPQRVKSFYTDVRMEMKKVTTPSFKEVRATSIVVIVAVFLFGLYFFLIDNGISFVVNRVIRYGQTLVR
ncbi:MAG TPA: preprotein translocase subunit SecE [Terriglobales bacterium]|nr:preprotein translocase subunit SecE [Terriglobales bacterium]